MIMIIDLADILKLKKNLDNEKQWHNKSGLLLFGTFLVQKQTNIETFFLSANKLCRQLDTLKIIKSRM